MEREMRERQKRSYVAEITNNSIEYITVTVDLENVDKEKAEKIICEMENAKEKIKSIMAG